MLVSLESITRPTRDALNAAKSLDDTEIRFVVDSYYQLQDYRKASGNQVRSMDQGADEGATHLTLDWLSVQLTTMENQIKRALEVYSSAHVMGPWLSNIYGIGPVISAGLLAHLSVEPWKCRHPSLGRVIDGKRVHSCSEAQPCTASCGRVTIPTVGHWWRYAGLDPTVVWNKGERRPFNAQLKTLCWKVGQSFMKFSGQPECFYGAIYRQRKAYELERNESGGNTTAAAAGLLRVGKTTDAHKHYGAGRLPPAQIDARARRYAVKLFLSHMHAQWYELHFGTQPPLPYPVAHMGHAHLIAAPA